MTHPFEITVPIKYPRYIWLLRIFRQKYIKSIYIHTHTHTGILLWIKLGNVSRTRVQNRLPVFIPKIRWWDHVRRWFGPIE